MCAGHHIRHGEPVTSCGVEIMSLSSCSREGGVLRKETRWHTAPAGPDEEESRERRPDGWSRLFLWGTFFSRALAKFLSSFWTQHKANFGVSNVKVRENQGLCLWSRQGHPRLIALYLLFYNWLRRACPGAVGGVLAREMATPPPVICLLESKIPRNILGPERKAGTTEA